MIETVTQSAAIDSNFQLDARAAAMETEAHEQSRSPGLPARSRAAAVVAADPRPAFGLAVVAEARSWIDTPFIWQASVKGRGCDCKGLIAGVAGALGRPEAISLPARIADYRKVNPKQLKAGLAALFDPTAEPGPGDILLLKVAGVAQHLAIFAGATMIHTYAKGPAKVIEVPLARVWRDAIDSAWTWRAVA